MEKVTFADKFSITWLDSGREPRLPPNPQYPHGIDLDLTVGAKVGCVVPLPYPAARCGAYQVVCKHCGYSALVTTAGRADDPRSLRIPCRTTA